MGVARVGAGSRRGPGRAFDGEPRAAGMADALDIHRTARGGRDRGHDRRRRAEKLTASRGGRRRERRGFRPVRARRPRTRGAGAGPFARWRRLGDPQEPEYLQIADRVRARGGRPRGRMLMAAGQGRGGHAQALDQEHEERPGQEVHRASVAVCGHLRGSGSRGGCSCRGYLGARRIAKLLPISRGADVGDCSRPFAARPPPPPAGVVACDPPGAITSSRPRGGDTGASGDRRPRRAPAWIRPRSRPNSRPTSPFSWPISRPTSRCSHCR